MRYMLYECDICHAVTDERGFKGLSDTDPLRVDLKVNQAPSQGAGLVVPPSVQVKISSLFYEEQQAVRQSSWGTSERDGLEIMYCSPTCHAAILQALAEHMINVAKASKQRVKPVQTDPAIAQKKEKYEKALAAARMK